MKTHNNENNGSTEWDKLERDLFLRFHTNKFSLPNPEEARVMSLEGIKEAHTEALRFFNSEDFKNAEQELIKVLRPVLSKPEIKALYVNVKDTLQETLSAMYHLGLIYLNESQYFNHHAKAAAIFQYCAEFSKEYKVSLKLDDDITGDQEYFIKQAHLVENKFCQDIGVGRDFNAGDATAKSENYKEELKQFRSTTAQKLETINDLGIDQIEARADEVKNIYNNCTNFFVNHSQNQNTTQAHDSSQNPGLVQRLLKDCYKQLEPVYPEGCKYAIVGLGSLSLGTMNPWSDLEFAILINEDREEYKEYFRNLTKLLWVKVINLQETPLSALGVEALNNYSTGEEQDNWFNDNLTQKAFRFDPVYEDACKSPLGRQGNYRIKEKDKETGTETTITKPDYELIATPEQMLVFQQEEVQFPEEYGNIKNWFEADKHLSQALQTVCLIDGSQKLLKEYRVKLREWRFINPTLHKDRTLKLMNEDVRKFSLKLGDEEEGKLLDAKQTIYRLGDRIVSVLAGYYNITAADDELAITVWQILDKMKAEDILSNEGAEHLREAISIATELRIRTYSHNKGRYDNISTYEPVITNRLTEEKRKELIEKTFHFKDIDILKHFYYVMLRVQNLLQEFCDQNSHNLAELVLKFDNLFADNNYAKGMVHARFLEYDSALKYMEAASKEKLDDLHVLEKLAILYKNTGKIEGSFNVGQTILDLIKSKYKDNPNHPDIAASYNNLGEAYRNKGEYEEAIKYFKEALNISLKSSPNSYSYLSIIMIYSNLGNAYLSKGEYEPAIKYHEQALIIRLGAYANNPNHPHVAASYNNLGSAYDEKGEYEQAISCHNRALEIRLKAYANSPNHPSIAMSYDNLGNAYSGRGEYGQAISYYQQALDIYLGIYQNSQNHPDIAKSYNNLGNAYLNKGEYEQAIKYHEQAWVIRLGVYANNPNHPDIAKSYNNLGNAYNEKGEYEQAIKYYQDALQKQLKAYEHSPNHPNIAKSCNNLGNAYLNKGEYKQAIK